MIITIDGPAASGKSTIAQRLANDLGYYYLYSGLLYRAVGFALIKKFEYHCSFPQVPKMADLQCVAADLEYCYHAVNGAQIMYQGSIVLMSDLKSAELDRAASCISIYPEVRQLLVDMQRQLAGSVALIADGRDCGTVVFPYADYKFYLTAALSVRAQRWYAAQSKEQSQQSLEQCYRLLAERDARDSSRAVAPLIVPPGGHVIDSSHLTLEATLAAFKEAIFECRSNDRLQDQQQPAKTK